MRCATKNVRFASDTFEKLTPLHSTPLDIDDEVKDHPIFMKQKIPSLVKCIQQQIIDNPKCKIIQHPETKTKMTRFGARYWNLLLSIDGDSAEKFMTHEREEYKKQFSKK